ncbi:hypothetical protein BDW71DRAFT_173468 [Aspergillus fruticulosus]
MVSKAEDERQLQCRLAIRGRLRYVLWCSPVAVLSSLELQYQSFLRSFRIVRVIPLLEGIGPSGMLWTARQRLDLLAAFSLCFFFPPSATSLR